MNRETKILKKQIEELRTDKVNLEAELKQSTGENKFFRDFLSFNYTDDDGKINVFGTSKIDIQHRKLEFQWPNLSLKIDFNKKDILINIPNREVTEVFHLFGDDVIENGNKIIFKHSIKEHENRNYWGDSINPYDLRTRRV